MRASKWVNLFQGIPSDEEVHIDGIVRERDLMQEAKFQGKTCTKLDAQFIIQKMDEQREDNDNIVEHYLELFTKGELDDKA